MKITMEDVRRKAMETPSPYTGKKLLDWDMMFEALIDLINEQNEETEIRIRKIVDNLEKFASVQFLNNERFKALEGKDHIVDANKMMPIHEIREKLMPLKKYLTEDRKFNDDDSTIFKLSWEVLESFGMLESHK